MLRDAQQSLVSTSNTITSKQQHCKNGLNMSTYLNLEIVTKFSEKKTMKQARQQTHRKTKNYHVRHPRRPGCSGGERCQNNTMGWKTRPFGTHHQRGKIPFNHNDCNQRH